MGIFVANIVLIIFWKLVSRFIRVNDKNKFFCVMVVLQLIMFFALRDWYMGGSNMRSDLLNYERHYEAVKSMSLWKSITHNDGKSVLYYFICAIFAKIGMPYEWFVVMLSVFFYIIIGKHIYKYSAEPMISFFVFLGTGTFTASFYLFRQVLAISFILIAYNAFCERRYLKTAIWILLAILVHSSAIVFIPLLFLSRLKISKLLISGYAIVLVASILFRVQIATIITMIFEQGYIGYYDSKFALGGNALMCLVITVVYVMFNYKNLISRMIAVKDIGVVQNNFSILHGLIILCIIQLCASFSYAFTRLNYYYIATILTIATPQCIDWRKAKTLFPKVCKIVTFILNVFLIGIMIWLHFVSLSSEEIIGVNPIWFR